MPYLKSQKLTSFISAPVGTEVKIISDRGNVQIVATLTGERFATHIDNLSDQPFEVVAIAEPVEDVVLVTPVKLKKATKNKVNNQKAMF